VKLVLHNYWRSSASNRVRIALGLKALAYDYVPVDILKGEQGSDAYARRNPNKQVPTLEIVEDDGRRVELRQSVAILEYLDERWPDPPLLPRGLEARAAARALAELVNSGIQPLQNLSTLKKVKEAGGDDKAWVRGFVHSGLTAFEAQVQLTVGKFCVGDKPTVADCFLVPQLYSADRFGVPLDPFPVCRRILEACHELPAFTRAHPDQQPDAVK
jgi:maleylpyruvate isomerase